LGILFKILSLLIAATGAFLVYGARFIAKTMVKNNGGVRQENRDNEIDSTDDENNGNMDGIILQKSVSLKKTGLLIMMAGCLLVLIAFRQ
jgi:hypothetical protein